MNEPAFNQLQRTGQNQKGWEGEGGLSFPLWCHVIVNEPIKIIQKTESDKKAETDMKST